MPQSSRKPTDIIGPNLRIRVELHRRLEQAAKRRDVSLNREMNDRLAASFDLAAARSLDVIADELRKVCDRLTA
jgi:HicB family